MNIQPIKQASDNIEANLLVFSFLLNFVWEMWQVPFYQGLASADHLAAVKLCTQASAGDSLITIIAFWSASLIAKSRRWIFNIRRIPLLVYWAVGLIITIVMEWLATGTLDRWQYADSMPRLPFMGTGLLPLLQWIVLPPIILFFVRRQTKS